MVLLRVGVSSPDDSTKAEPLVTAVPQSGCWRDSRLVPWKGVNLGGWLLLEPGPSSPLFASHPDPHTGLEAQCEWDLMEVLLAMEGQEGARRIVQRHRNSHITQNDFWRIRACGLNAVRLPLGYWVVTGPSSDVEPYVGPALEYVDKAVDWAEDAGLEVVLDLHGCPGGESGEAPCGRRQRPHGTWHWRHWRFDQTLEVLEMLARRYSSRACVTGIAVCNEPSNSVPTARLIQYYDLAVDTIRMAGMAAHCVAVLLPLFQRPEAEFVESWRTATQNRHRNICFDVHCYHCFENEFHGKTLAQHLRAIEENAAMLRQYPMVVGEWSLSLGHAAWATCGLMDDYQVYKLFGLLQLEAFQEASHGLFFWNWTERDTVEWNFQQACQLGLLSGLPLSLPAWDGFGEDPLEEIVHPSPPEPRIFYGDRAFLRTFHGSYIDVCGSSVSARWADKGEWQELTFCLPMSVAARVQSQRRRRAVLNGDVVRLRAHNGIIYLQSCATGAVLDAHEEEEGLFTRWEDFGAWQQLAVEKVPLDGGVPPLPSDIVRHAAAVSCKRRRLLRKTSSDTLTVAVL